MRMTIMAAVVCLASATVWGQVTTRWQGPDGGTWNNPANWDSGVPVDSNFSALITSFAGTILLDTDIPAEVKEIKFNGNGSDVIFDLQGHDIAKGMSLFQDAEDSVQIEFIDSVGGGTMTGSGAFYRNNRSDEDAEYGLVSVGDNIVWTSTNGWKFPGAGNGINWYPADMNVVFKDQAQLINNKTFNIANADYAATGATHTLTIQDQALVQEVTTSATPSWGFPDKGYAGLNVVGSQAMFDYDGHRLTWHNGGLRVEIDDTESWAATIDFRRSLDLGTVDLDIDLADGVTPDQDQVFDILLYNTQPGAYALTGTFTQDPEDVGVWEIIYDTANSKVQAKYLLASAILGDVNGDGVVDGLDIQPFVDLLTGGGYQAEADINADAVVDGLDIQPFVDIITGGGGNPVPEPATLGLVLLGGLAAVRRRVR